MSRITDIKTTLFGITGVGQVCSSTKKFTGKNLGKLIREFGSLADLETAVVDIDADSGIPFGQDSTLLTGIDGGGGSLVGSATTIDGNLSFPSSGDNAQFSSIPGVADLPFTISAWVYPQATLATENAVWCVGSGLAGGEQLLLTIQELNANLSFDGTVDATNVAFTSSQDSITTDSWQHISFVYNTTLGSGMLYINGSLDGQGNIGDWLGYDLDEFTSWQIGADEVALGGSYNNKNLITGFIVTKAVLDADAITNLANLTRPPEASEI